MGTGALGELIHVDIENRQEDPDANGFAAEKFWFITFCNITHDTVCGCAQTFLSSRRGALGITEKCQGEQPKECSNEPANILDQAPRQEPDPP